jgi:hypothetical protein
MAKKTISKRPNQRKKRETIKRGGMKSLTRKQTKIINELAEVASLNKDIAANIMIKVNALQNLYTDESPKSLDKSPKSLDKSPKSLDKSPKSLDESPKSLKSLEEEENISLSSPSKSIRSVEDITSAQYEPLNLLPDIEPTTTNSVSDKKTVFLNKERTNTAKPDTWDFYILQFLDEEPKTENEITNLILEQYPHKFKGKTSDNTINYRLQKLVREGKAKRIEHKKGKRNAYRYFV